MIAFQAFTCINKKCVNVWFIKDICNIFARPLRYVYGRCLQNVCPMLHYSKDGITIAIVQDTRKELANGDYPIKVRVVYNRKAKYFSTGKSLSTHDWNIL